MLGLHGHQTAFLGLPDVEVCAFVDSNPKDRDVNMAITQAKRHYSTYQEMLEKEDLDIVQLCSRHPADHLPQIRDLAECGIHVYCEKPMALNLEEANEIIRLVEANGVKLCMAHPGRYTGAYLQMKDMIEAGEIGTPLTAYGRGKSDNRGGVEDLIVLGTHILDLQTFFFGNPESVMAEVRLNGRAARRSDRGDMVEPLGNAAGDEVFASFRFPNDLRFLFESRKGLYGNDGRSLMGFAVHGTKGTLSMRFFDMKDAPLRFSRLPYPPDDDAAYEDVPLADTRSIPGAAPLDYSLCGKLDVTRSRYFQEANRFAAWDLMCSIREGREPVSNATNARVVQEMIFGIYESHLSRRTIDFPLDDTANPFEKGSVSSPPHAT